MKYALSALALATAVTANADLITLTGSIDQAFVPADDDYGYSGGIYLGREVHLNQESDVTFTAVFSESSYQNAFISIGGVLYDNVIDGATTTERLGGGLIPFSFLVQDTGLGVSNGVNQQAWEETGPQPHFAVSEVLEDGNSWLIGLQDDGNSIDYDFDDFVLRMTVEPVNVPEPMPAMLLGLGLIGVGLTRLKKRA